jgi:hypothetical protein
MRIVWCVLKSDTDSYENQENIFYISNSLLDYSGNFNMHNKITVTKSKQDILPQD